MSISRLLQNATAGLAPKTAWTLDNVQANFSPSGKVLVNRYNATNGARVTIGPKFSSDGSKFYLLDQSADRIHQYDTLTSYALPIHKFEPDVIFATTNNEISPAGFTFKPDGTRLYVIGLFGDNITEYSLSTAWDLGSTVTYVQDSTFLGGAPYGLFFKPDGTKAYYVNNSVDQVVELTMSTAWDIPNMVSNDTFSVTGQASYPTDVYFDTTGTKMYVADNSSDGVYQYTLSTAWDLTTASYADKSFSASLDTYAEDSLYSVMLSNDGTKLYTSGYRHGAVVEHDMSTAWDVSTASNIGVRQASSGNYYFASGVSMDRGIHFKPDGTKMYHSAYNALKQYTLSTAWDLTTATAGSDLDVSSYSSFNMKGIFFKPDGTKMYSVTDFNNIEDIVEWSLSTAWDSSTASSPTRTDINTHVETSYAQIFISDDGTNFYVYNANNISRFTLSTAWDTSTASHTSTYDFTYAISMESFGLYFKEDGTKMFTISNPNTRVAITALREYSLSTAWDTTTLTLEQEYPIGHDIQYPKGIFIKENGRDLFVAQHTISGTQTTGCKIQQFSLE